MTKVSRRKTKIAAPGVARLGPFGPYKNSVWMFWHRGEAALCEMPPYKPGRESAPWRSVGRFLKRENLELKYALISHAHFDHCQTLMEFREAFPEADFVAHRSPVHTRVVERLAGRYGWSPWEVFQEVFDGDLRALELGGEPLLLLHAPKHSMSDLFVIFRGTAMTGDWFLGDLKDCNALVAPTQKVRSVETVQRWLNRLDYRVSRAFSGHGDCLYYDIDFQKLLEQSKVDHG